MNDLKLVIGNKNYSSWSLRPWLFLKYFDISFEEEMVYLYETGTKEKLQAYLSNDKVPLLFDYDEGESFQVWDSLAIIEYANDKFLNQQGWPKDLRARALARSISAEMHSGFFALRNSFGMDCKQHYPNHPVPSDVQLEIDRIITIWEYCHQNYGKSGPWLFGEFSGADAMFAPIALRLSIYDVKVSGFVREYIETVLQNEHVHSWVEAGKKETQIIDFSAINI